MKLTHQRTLGLATFTFLYPATALNPRYLPNPRVPGTSVTLTVIFPMLARYFYGRLNSAFAGATGTALSALMRGAIYDGLAIDLAAILPISAGRKRRPYQCARW